MSCSLTPTRTARRAALCFLLAGLAVAVLGRGPAHAQPGDKKDEPKLSALKEKALKAFNESKFDEALKLLEEERKATPSLPPARLTLSTWMYQARQGREARLLLEQAAAEAPNHPEVLLVNASYALAEGRVTDTIHSCEIALIMSGSWGGPASEMQRYRREARLGLVTALEARGDAQSMIRAREHLQALVTADANPSSQLILRLARANFLVGAADAVVLGDLQKAYDAAKDANMDPPELSLAQLHAQKAAGAPADQKPDYASAEKWFGDAVNKYGNAAPKTPGAAAAARVQRGFAGYLIDRGLTERAKAHVEAAEKLEPDSRETLALVGLLARYQKNTGKAIEVFERLYREHPTFTFAQANLALLLADIQASRTRAVGMAQSNVNQNPKSPDAYAVLGYALFRRGQGGSGEKDDMTTAERALGTSLAMASGQAGLDTVYYLALLVNETTDPKKGEKEKTRFVDVAKDLRRAIDKPGAFVFRDEAKKLLADMEKREPIPADKKDDKKP